MTNYTNPWTGKPVDTISDLLPRSNGQTCDECGSPCIDNCIMCSAPQCCPACCYDATPSARITSDKDRGSPVEGAPLDIAELRRALAYAQGEQIRLLGCLAKANAATEEYERKFYLTSDECNRLRDVLRYIADVAYVDHQSGNQNFEHLQSMALDALGTKGSDRG